MNSVADSKFFEIAMLTQIYSLKALSELICPSELHQRIYLLPLQESQNLISLRWSPWIWEIWLSSMAEGRSNFMAQILSCEVPRISKLKISSKISEDVARLMVGTNTDITDYASPGKPITVIHVTLMTIMCHYHLSTCVFQIGSA